MVSTHSRRSIKVNMSSGSSEKDGERRRSEKEREIKRKSRIGSEDGKTKKATGEIKRERGGEE